MENMDYDRAKNLIEKSNDVSFLKDVLIEFMENTTWFLSDIPSLYNKQKRFFVGYSNTANAYAVFDRYDKVPENSNGYAILWGTFNPCKSEVTKECNELNEEFERTGHVEHLGI